jgi:putative ABC transport system substrate-binding protein
MPAPVHSDAEIETAIIALGREPGGGLLVMSDVSMLRHHAAITSAAARNNVPAVYPNSSQARDGGLLSYGPPGDGTDIRRLAASYIDRILRGAKPGDPVKYVTVVNLKTAKALGLAVPPSIMLRADEVIE